MIHQHILEESILKQSSYPKNVWESMEYSKRGFLWKRLSQLKKYTDQSRDFIISFTTLYSRRIYSTQSQSLKIYSYRESEENDTTATRISSSL